MAVVKRKRGSTSSSSDYSSGSNKSETVDHITANKPTTSTAKTISQTSSSGSETIDYIPTETQPLAPSQTSRFSVTSTLLSSTTNSYRPDDDPRPAADKPTTSTAKTISQTSSSGSETIDNIPTEKQPLAPSQTSRFSATSTLLSSTTNSYRPDGDPRPAANKPTTSTAKTISLTSSSGSEKLEFIPTEKQPLTPSQTSRFSVTSTLLTSTTSSYRPDGDQRPAPILRQHRPRFSRAKQSMTSVFSTTSSKNSRTVRFKSIVNSGSNSISRTYCKDLCYGLVRLVKYCFYWLVVVFENILHKINKFK